MLFSYLLVGLLIGLIAALLGFGQEGLTVCMGSALPIYFMEVAVRGFASLVRHRRITYQLADLGAFLLVVALYALSTSYSEKAEVPMIFIGPTLYFGVTFWASKHLPMAPPRNWGNWIPGLPLLWQRHLRRDQQGSSVAD